MAAIDSLKNELIDKILVTKNQKFLEVIKKLFELNTNEEKFEFDSHQIEMLQMGMNDLENGDLLSETELNKLDAEWLK